MTPHSPLVPCTDTAPTGSSTFMTLSMNSTDRQTSTPAIKPITQAPTGFTNPLGAVIATRPAKRPLPVMEASGFPYRSHIYIMAPKLPVIPASMVLTAIDPMRKLPLLDAPSVEPGLNPNQPKARMKQPVRTITISWASIGLDFPSRVYLPMGGPMTIDVARAVTPPTACTTPDPAKSQ